MKIEENAEPHFWRDIRPYFIYPVMAAASIIAMVYTGNHFLPFWMLYLLAPSTKVFSNKDTEEVAESAQKKFLEDKRYNIPLYAVVLVSTSTWAWSLVMLSDKYEIEGRWFS